MIVPCHKNTCSVHWSTEVVPGEGLSYVADVDLDDLRGLSCSLPGGTGATNNNAGGVGILLDPAGGNLATLSGSGLKVMFPESSVVTFGAQPNNNNIDPGASAAAPVYGLGPGNAAAPYYWANSTGRDCVVLVHGQFNYEFAILGTGSSYLYTAGEGRRASSIATGPTPVPGTVPATEAATITPYNAAVRYRLLLAQAAGVNPAIAHTNAVLSVQADIGGMIYVSNGSYEKKIDRHDFMQPVIVPAGNHLGLRGDVFYGGPDQTLNVIAGGSGDLSTDGFALYNLELLVLPIT